MAKNERLCIAHVDYDDYENHNIEYDNNGAEILLCKINYKEIMQDLQRMILPHYRNGDDLEEYFKLYNVNKYTYMCFKKYIEFDDTYIEYWEKNRGQNDKKIYVELEADYY
jgi:hypothetical protein